MTLKALGWTDINSVAKLKMHHPTLVILGEDEESTMCNKYCLIEIHTTRIQVFYHHVILLNLLGLWIKQISFIKDAYPAIKELVYMIIILCL